MKIEMFHTLVIAVRRLAPPLAVIKKSVLTSEFIGPVSAGDESLQYLSYCITSLRDVAETWRCPHLHVRCTCDKLMDHPDGGPCP